MQQNKKGIATSSLVELILGAIVILVMTFIIYGPAQAAYSRGTCEGNQGTCDEKAYVYAGGQYQCNQNAGYLPTTFQCKNKIGERYTPRPCCLFISDEEREQGQTREEIAEIGSGMEKIAPSEGEEALNERDEKIEESASLDEEEKQQRRTLQQRADQLKREIEATEDREEQYHKKLQLVELYGQLDYQRMVVELLEDIAKNHPSEEGGAVALYTLAEIYGNQELYVSDPYLAIETYERFIEKYPVYVPDSAVYLELFKIAMINLEDVNKAQEYYQLIKEETSQYKEEADEINRRLSLDDAS